MRNSVIILVTGNDLETTSESEIALGSLRRLVFEWKPPRNIFCCPRVLYPVPELSHFSENIKISVS